MNLLERLRGSCMAAFEVRMPAYVQRQRPVPAPPESACRRLGDLPGQVRGPVLAGLGGALDNSAAARAPWQLGQQGAWWRFGSGPEQQLRRHRARMAAACRPDDRRVQTKRPPS